MWYFAYGSNLLQEKLFDRADCSPREQTQARLQDWRLAFTLKAIPMLEPSMATVEEATGAVVHGMAWHIDEAEFERIRVSEGGGKFYTVVDVELEAYDGRKLEAKTLALLQEKMRFSRDMPPSRRYLDMIRDGAVRHALDPDYCHRLIARPHAPNRPLFDAIRRYIEPTWGWTSKHEWNRLHVGLILCSTLGSWAPESIRAAVTWMGLTPLLSVSSALRLASHLGVTELPASQSRARSRVDRVRDLHWDELEAATALIRRATDAPLDELEGLLRYAQRYARVLVTPDLDGVAIVFPPGEVHRVAMARLGAPRMAMQWSPPHKGPHVWVHTVAVDPSHAEPEALVEQLLAPMRIAAQDQGVPLHVSRRQ